MQSLQPNAPVKSAGPATPAHPDAELEYNQLWSLEKVCEVLGGISDDTFHRLVARNEFQRVKQGRSTFALAREVRAYVERLVAPKPRPGPRCSNTPPTRS